MMKFLGHLVPRMYTAVILLLLAISAISAYSLRQVPYALAAAVATCIITEIVITRFYHKHSFGVPYSAIITGLIIGAVAPISGPIPLVVLASLIALLSKHFLKIKRSNVFNPAAIGLLVSLALFGLGDEWWAAAAYPLHSVMIPVSLLLIIGAFEAKRLATAASYIVVTIAATTAISSISSAVSIGSIATIALTTNYFFPLLMVADPKTSPVKPHVQLVFGAGVALIALAGGMMSLPYALLIAIIIGNLAYAGYRLKSNSR